jgi:hypothetical protein
MVAVAGAEQVKVPAAAVAPVVADALPPAAAVAPVAAVPAAEADEPAEGVAEPVVPDPPQAASATASPMAKARASGRDAVMGWGLGATG